MSLFPDGKGSKSPMFWQQPLIMSPRELALYKLECGAFIGPSRAPRDTGPIDLSSYIPLGVDPNRKGGSW